MSLVRDIKRFFHHSPFIMCILLFLAIYLILNNVYVTYETIEDYRAYFDCFNGTAIPKTVAGLVAPKPLCYCPDYIPHSIYSLWKTKQVAYCDEFNKPKCACKTTIWERWIKPLF